MLTQFILPYCLFYKGEAACPLKYDGKPEGQLWYAEKVICENMPNVIDKDPPRRSLTQYVSAYVGKWNPYGEEEVMQVYLNKAKES